MESVERAFNALLEDAERLGPLSNEHVVGVAARRGLGAEQAAELVRLLRRADMLEDAVPPGGLDTAGTDEPGLVRGGDPSCETPGEMPGGLLNHPVMRAEQEVTLGRRIQLGLKAKEALMHGEVSAELQALALDGDIARQTMVRNNVRLAKRNAEGFLHACGDLEFEDLIQDGILGLNRAAEKFDPERGYKFSTYATWWIRQFISRAIDDTGSLVRLPVHVRDELRQIMRYQRHFEMRNHRFPTLLETAEGVAKDSGTVQAILDYATPVIRLDEPLGDELDGDQRISLLLAHGVSVEDEVIDRAVFRAIEQRLEQLAKGYDPRFLRIMEGRFGLHGHDEMTLEALGQEFRVTRERIRQLETKIRKKIRDDPVLLELGRDYRRSVNGAA
jgi:RNA polymerase sigma factor (sigma-70 family)